jgi:hypothetical protein
MGCESCGAVPAEFFTTAGAQVCKRCYNAEQLQLQDARAEASLAAEMPEGVPRAKKKRPPKPGRVLLIGVVLMTMALVGNLGLLIAFGEFDFKLIAGLGFAFVVVIQGYKTRHYQ